MTSEQPMTDRTPISLGLVMTIVGAIVMIVGAFVWLQADVAMLKVAVSEQKDISQRMNRLEMLTCVTDDVARARACQQMGVLQ
jgi:hypothetical protein